MPSKSDGPLTSVTTSKFVSRKRSVRDSGNAAAETFATSLDCDIMRKSGLKPTTATSSPGTSVLVTNVAALDRRVADQLRVVRDDGQVVQRMDVLDAARDLERARERQPHVAHGDGHGVAVDDDPAALGVGDEPGAVVVAIGDARTPCTACRS